MNQLLSINEDTLIVNKLQLNWTTGNLTHVGNASVQGTFNSNGTATFNDIVANGNITANTLTVKNLINESGQSVEPGIWSFNNESDLVGKGLSWTWGNGTTQLSYRSGGNIWTNGNFDLRAGSTYKIDDVAVITANSLGTSIVNSNLQTIGTLENLEVSGDTTLGQFVYFNSISNRLGIGTEEPNAAFSILENNVEIIVGSPATNLGEIGTYTNHDFAIVTDNTARITVKNSGEINIGSPTDKTGVVNIYGTLNVSNLVTDTRLDRTSPLTFQSTKDTSIYGLGLVWTNGTVSRRFTMAGNPERIYSSEIIDLAADRFYSIDNQVVLTSSGLGPGVVSSNLTSVGALIGITVQGTSNLLGPVIANAGIATSSLNANVINSDSTITVSTQDSTVLYGDNQLIEIGNRSNGRRPIKVYGPLSVNITNPDPSLSFSVAGDVNIGNKRFTNGISAPTTGSYELGDLCWSTNPQPGGYIGWVCVLAGNPGTWVPFGNIANQ